jgi:hypothetical protein
MTTLARIDTATTPTPRHALRPVLWFAAVALPLGWVMLTVPIVFGLPAEPFVLATTILGLFLPAVLITARQQGRGAVRALLRQAIRPHRPLWSVAAAALVLTAAVWLTAVAVDGARPLTATVLGSFAFQFLLAVALLHAAFNASAELVDPRYDVARLATTIVLGATAALLVTMKTRASRPQ